MTARPNRRPAELRIGGGHASPPPIATMDQPHRAGMDHVHAGADDRGGIGADIDDHRQHRATKIGSLIQELGPVLEEGAEIEHAAHRPAPPRQRASQPPSTGRTTPWI